MIFSDQELERLGKIYVGKSDGFRTRVTFFDFLECQPVATEIDEGGHELPRVRTERFIPKDRFLTVTEACAVLASMVQDARAAA